MPVLEEQSKEAINLEINNQRETVKSVLSQETKTSFDKKTKTSSDVGEVFADSTGIGSIRAKNNSAKIQGSNKEEELIQVIDESVDIINCNSQNIESLSRKINNSNNSKSRFSDRKIAELSQTSEQFKILRNKLDEGIRRCSIERSENEEDFQAHLKWFFYKGDSKYLNFIKKLRQNPLYSSEDSLRLLENTENEIRNRVKQIFQLLGFSNPFDEYPSPVVPIGKYQNELVATYPESIDSLLLLNRDHEYIKIEDLIENHKYTDLKYIQSVQDFNYIEYKLFAFSSEEIVCFLIEEEKEFYCDVLTKYGNLARHNPFLRFSLAKITENIDIIQRELTQCIVYMQSISPTMISSWFEDERELLSPLWLDKGLDFPKLKSMTDK